MATFKTFRLLKGDQPDRGKIEELFAQKNDQELLGALANPEHSEAARNILQTIADERGLQSEEERGWAQTEESMYVAPFGRRPTFEDALAAPVRRRRVYRSLQLIILLSLVAAIFAFQKAGSTYKEWVQQGIDSEVDHKVVARFREIQPSPGDEKIYLYLHGLNLFAKELRQSYNGNASKLDNYNKAIDAFIERYKSGVEAGVMGAPDDHRLVEAFLALVDYEFEYLFELRADYDFVFDHFATHSEFEPQGPGIPTSENIGAALLFGGPALWLFGGIFSWIRPSRTLLLRPFQAKKISKPLKRFAQKNLSFRGHTITLSDKFVKDSGLAYALSWVPRGPVDLIVIPLFFIPAIRQFQRWVHVKSPRSYRFLKKRLARRFTMTMFWQNSITKLLKVKCSDTWWKQAVDLLMYSCHLIVVDMSWVKEGTEWELDKIDRRNLERKTVFVVSEDAAEYAREVIAKFWPHEEAPPPLYVYHKSGRLLDREDYERDVARIISESHLWEGVPA